MTAKNYLVCMLYEADDRKFWTTEDLLDDIDALLRGIRGVIDGIEYRLTNSRLVDIQIQYKQSPEKSLDES